MCRPVLVVGGKYDIATGLDDAQGAKTTLEGLCNIVGQVKIAEIDRVWTGIDYVRDTFPYLYFDRKAINKTWTRGKQQFPSLGECMGNYHQAEMLVGKKMTMEPVHDIYSHGCDALRTFCEGWQRGLIGRRTARAAPELEAHDEKTDSLLAGSWW